MNTKKLTLLALSIIFVGGAVALYAYQPQRINAAEELGRCEATGDDKQKCLGEAFDTTARTEGIGSALDLLAGIYVLDRSFADYCHGHTHELGRIAYEYFSGGKDLTLSDKTAYCGFGFFHGFLEGLFEETNDLAEARRFCEYVDASLLEELKGVSFACYHGIGHGVVDGSEPSRWGDAGTYIQGGLDLCDVLSEVEEHKERCASGVFNALAIAYMDPKYELSPDPEDPYAICRRQEIRYAREACYDQMNGYINQVAPDFAAALKLASGAEALYRQVAIESVASFRAQSALGSGRPLPEFLEACETLTELGNACARGFASGLMEFGNPGKEHEVAVEACRSSRTHVPSCLRGVSAGIRDRLKQEAHADACALVGGVSGGITEAECNEIVATGYAPL